MNKLDLSGLKLNQPHIETCGDCVVEHCDLSGLKLDQPHIEDCGDYVIEHTHLGPIKRKKYKHTSNTIMTNLGPIEPANWADDDEDLNRVTDKYCLLFQNHNTIKDHVKDLNKLMKYIWSDLKNR